MNDIDRHEDDLRALNREVEIIKEVLRVVVERVMNGACPLFHHKPTPVFREVTCAWCGEVIASPEPPKKRARRKP